MSEYDRLQHFLGYFLLVCMIGFCVGVALAWGGIGYSIEAGGLPLWIVAITAMCGMIDALILGIWILRDERKVKSDDRR